MAKHETGNGKSIRGAAKQAPGKQAPAKPTPAKRVPAEKAASKQRSLQVAVEKTRSKEKDRKPSKQVAKRAAKQDEDRKDSKEATKKAIETRGVQAGARVQPSKMPAQHLRQPGMEADLELAPRFDAPDYKGSGKLDGMVAIVTGGDSGIGRSVSVLFAREGADVVVLYLTEHEDARQTQRSVEAEGRRCLLIPGDVGDSEFCDRAVADTVAEFGRVDVLVNNAAFQQHIADIEDISDEQFEQTFRTNVFGYFHMARAVVPHMSEGSAIINNGSVTGLFGSKALLDYSATKGAIHAFTQSLASNLVSRGIRVNAVAPGPVWTPLNPADIPAKKVGKFGEKNPMGRAAQPEEIAPAFVYLAAPVCSSYVTGIVLPVMGGPTG